MTDVLLNQETPVIEPVTASADGRRNAYTMGCAALGQSMNYAACLHRQKVLGDKTLKAPADWQGCAEAAKRGNCVALQMREQELLQGRSIYFRAREAVKQMADAARKWFMPSMGKSAPAKKTSKPASMFDAMGDAGTFADAITAAAADKEGHMPLPEKRIPVAIPVAQAGETPLQMARRLAAERAANGVAA